MKDKEEEELTRFTSEGEGGNNVLKLARIKSGDVVGKTEIIVEEGDEVDDNLISDEKEKSNETIFVNGVKMLLEDVTDKDQEMMTDQERSAYREMMASDDDDDY